MKIIFYWDDMIFSGGETSSYLVIILFNSQQMECGADGQGGGKDTYFSVVFSSTESSLWADV